jgi:hypothetical protein
MVIVSIYNIYKSFENGWLGWLLGHFLVYCKKMSKINDKPT